MRCRAHYDDAKRAFSYAAPSIRDARELAASSIGGYTPDQRFFLAYAQIWASNDRPEFERLMVNTNPHPLGRFRAIAAPSNMPAFAAAFGCKDGDAMLRPSAIRCQIW